MSVYMVRGYHSNSGCRGFLCVHGTGFSQDSGCVEFLCQCTWCEVITAILAVGDFSVYMVQGSGTQDSGCVEFLCQCTWCEVITAILAVGDFSVYMVQGSHSNSGCVEFLCQCTWCEVITAILAVWNFCVSVHGARLSQQFWLCGISVSVYMVRGYHSNSGCRGFLCVHGTGFSQDFGCVEFLCQCTWCEVITAILAVGDFSVYMVQGSHSNSGCVEFLCQCTWCEVLTAILAVWNFCVSVHGARLSQQFWLCGISVSVYMVRGYHSNSGCVEFLCQCTWSEVLTAIQAVWNFWLSVHGARFSQQFWLCGISVSVYMVRGYHSNSAVWNFCVSVHGTGFSQDSGCVEFLCQCTWCEVITAILAVWNFCVSVHGPRFSQQFRLCGISVSVYMVRGSHSNSGCVEFLCECTWCEVITAILAVWNFCVSVHGTGFSQDSGCVEFLCQCTWCEVLTAILAVGRFCVYRV